LEVIESSGKESNQRKEAKGVQEGQAVCVEYAGSQEGWKASKIVI
tara:strand:+ start:1351 stop:1485 length:135 start_codon:yes stop_codon:yes gene_type:complete